MKRFIAGIFIISLFSSCDDGEIIVTNFEFDESTFQFCEGPNKNVIYAVNSNDVYESISLEYNNNQLVAGEDGNLLPPDEDEITFPINENNRIVYRIYSDALPNQYFCQVVPPSEPVIIEEWVSEPGATAVVRTGFIDESADADPDDDGLNNSAEGWQTLQDTDGDGIPDYLDIDDDGDNVSTETERANENNYPQEEGAIPYYLNSDDDNDGVPTRLEVSVETGLTNPQGFSLTADNVPNFLNPQQTARLEEHDEYIPHNISRDYGYLILITGLKFENQNGSGESIQYETYEFGTLRQRSIPFPLCPYDPDCSEETEEEEEPEITPED